jgi:hypothetical protein
MRPLRIAALVLAATLAAYRAWVSYRETAELMADPGALREIAESQAEYARGEFTTGEEAGARFGLPPTGDFYDEPLEDIVVAWPRPKGLTGPPPAGTP